MYVGMARSVYLMTGFRSVRSAVGSLLRRLGLRGPISERSARLALHETATGRFYLPADAKMDIIARAIIDSKVYDEKVYFTALKHIKPGPAVLDVGANFGQMSVLYSKAVGPTGKVYSFEADKFIFEVLSKNLDANGCVNAVPVFGAVHDVPGVVLHYPEHNFERFTTYGAYGIDYNAKTGQDVQSLTIDGLSINEPVSFMKVDIQGGDLFALRGAVETIKRNRMPIIFEYEEDFQEDYKLSFQDYVDFVRGIGYKFDKVVDKSNYLIIPN